MYVSIKGSIKEVFDTALKAAALKVLCDSIRDAMDTKNVQAARASLFEQASIEHARSIVGFIQPAPDEPQPVTPHDGGERPGYVNGLAFTDEPPAKKVARH